MLKTLLFKVLSKSTHVKIKLFIIIRVLLFEKRPIVDLEYQVL